MEPLNKLFLDLEVVFNPDYCVSHDKDEIEYIRKDALLEWAENWGKYKLLTDDGFLYAMELLINKLNSM